jgi:hypothetical protein
MEKQTIYITKYTLSPLFEKTIKLLKPTWKASLVSCAIVFVPLAVLSGFFIQYFFSAYFTILGQIIGLTKESASADPWKMLAPLIPMLGLAFGFSFISGIARVFVQGIVSRNAFRSASGESIGWKALMLETLRAKFGSLVVFYILESLILIGGLLILAMVATGIIVLLVVIKAYVAAILLGILFYLLLFFAFFCIAYVFQFGPSVVVNEEIGGGEAIARCFKLIKGDFFRVLGISLLFGIALSLAINLVISPFEFAALIPFYVKIFQMSSAISDSGAAEMLQLMRDAFSGTGFLFGILSGLELILSGMINPLFSTLFYVDLRVRKGELPDAAEFADIAGQGQA